MHRKIFDGFCSVSLLLIGFTFARKFTLKVIRFQVVLINDSRAHSNSVMYSLVCNPVVRSVSQFYYRVVRQTNSYWTWNVENVLLLEVKSFRVSLGNPALSLGSPSFRKLCVRAFDDLSRASFFTTFQSLFAFLSQCAEYNWSQEKLRLNHEKSPALRAPFC